MKASPLLVLLLARPSSSWLFSESSWPENTAFHNTPYAKKLKCPPLSLGEPFQSSLADTEGYVLCGSEGIKNSGSASWINNAHESMYVHAALNPARAMPSRSDAAATQRRVFLDIGTNAGFFSVLAASRGYEVFSFEPQPMCNDILMRTKQEIMRRAKDPPPWHLFEVGVTDGEKEVHFEVFRDRCGMNWHLASKTVKTTATAVALSRIIKGSAAARTIHPVFAKIDVDGGEARILKSIDESINLGSLRALPEVIIEINARFWKSFGTTYEEGEAIFQAFGARYTTIYYFDAYKMNRYGRSACEAQPAAQALLEPCPRCVPANAPAGMQIKRVTNFAKLLAVCVKQDRLGDPKAHGQMNVWFAG